MFTDYKDMKGNAKWQNVECGVVWGARSDPRSPSMHHSRLLAYNFLFNYRNYVYILYSFRVIASYFVESCLFKPTPPAFDATVEVTPFKFR